MEKDNKEKEFCMLNVRVAPAIHSAIKFLALEKKTSMQKEVEDALLAYLESEGMIDKKLSKIKKTKISQVR